jgi:serine/threonine protein phosphatase 1
MEKKRYIYAVGDVHGRFDLMQIAERRIDEHIASHDATAVVIFLGDYVDRGPQSKEVVERLMEMTKDNPSCIALKGNHEDMMIDAITGTGISLWWQNGGDATMTSYSNDVPMEHIDWMKDLPTMVKDDQGRVYVHAGLMPDVSADDQQDEWNLWIRDRFLNARADQFDVPHIVHGHTPYHYSKKPDAPELLPHRTNLDTAAFHTGILTIGVFDADEPGGPIEIIQVKGDFA